MRHPRLAVLLLAACGGSTPTATPTPAPPVAPKPSPYPAARKGDTTEVQFGITVADPYRWLEAMDSEETRTWVRAENQLTDDFFAKTPGQAVLRERLGQLFRTETFTAPRSVGGRVFWRYGDGKGEQPVLVTAKSLDAPATPLVDPNPDAAGGAQTFTSYVVDGSGKRVSYGIASGAGDWESWHVRDVDGKQDLPDVLPGIKYYSPVFARDGASLYYSRFPTPKVGSELTETDHDCKVFVHHIGQPANQDTVVYERPENPTWQYRPWMSADGRLLVLAIGDGEVGDRRQEQIVAFDLSRGNAKPIALVDKFEAEYVPIGASGSVVYFLTDRDAPTKRVIAIDTSAPDRGKWKKVVAATPDVLLNAQIVGDQILVVHMHDVHSVLSAHDLGGKKLRDIELPGLGTVRLFPGERGSREAFYTFASFIAPTAIYRYDLASGASRLWKAPKVPFDSAGLETRQIFYKSKDGTRVPMFVTAKKNLTLDGSHPTILTGYGGGGISSPPGFRADMIEWIERGGVFVVANIRGGGEYGEAWHHAAMRTRRQVTYDDFIAAGEALIAEKITQTSHLGITGRSGGGEMVSAVLMQRPDLFGACVPIAGVMDMLRFQLFGQGAGWQGDFGSPGIPDEMKALFAGSPLHNVRAGTTYPPTLIITADHDVRVAPLHSYKLAAAMQAAQAGPAPMLLRVQTNSGHHGGDLVSQRIQQDAELLAFFARELGLPLE